MTEHNRCRPVLMIPLRRCGSHALRLRFNLNPQFYAPYPLHIVDFMELLPLYGDLTNDSNYFQLIVDVIGLQNASMVKWDIVCDPVTVFEAIKNKPRSIHRVMWELLFLAGHAHGAEVVMDKSLDSVFYIHDLLKEWPDMKFLNVVRDPRAQVSSMNRAIIYDWHTALNAQRWLKAHEKALQIAHRYPDQVLTIRYEDFISNQEAVLRKICEFFGIEFVENMLDISKSSEAREISKRSRLWESNFNAPIAANVDKFQKNLTPEEIAIIESTTGALMDLYGYERVMTSQIAITQKYLTEGKLVSETKKKAAWETLKKDNPQDYILRQQRANYIKMVRDSLERNPVPGPASQVA